MAIALGAYFPQFSGLKENLTNQHEQVLKKFGKDYDIVSAGMVDSMEASARAGKLFKENDVDIVFCQCTTYSTSSNLSPAVKDLDVPVVLLNIQHLTALDMDKTNKIDQWLGDGFSCGCVPEMVAVLRRLGKRCDVITGYLEGDEEVDTEIDKWCKASIVGRRFRTTSLGLIGRPYPGMMDLYVDETKLFSELGIFTEMLEWEDVVQSYKDIDKGSIKKQSEKILSTFEVSGTVPEKELEYLASSVCGLENLVKEKKLSAIASHYATSLSEEVANLIAVLNPAYSMLIEQNIACAVEGDMKVSLAMSILKNISGTGTLAELYSMDFDDNICLIGHSGSGDPAISGQKPLLKYSEVFHGKAGGGYLTQFYPKLGEITALALTQDETGGYKMVAAEGINREGPVLKLGDTNCRASFDIGLREFVNRWSLTGPTHHFALATGSQIDKLKCVSSILNIPLEIVCTNK
ncbi:MAG: arabinose isomerase [Actinomycetia bacterium]|nr:arabinose isomerase [Actinomycetes bacterium]